MAKKNNISLLDPSVIVSTFFYSGKAKFAPGTVGTVAALPFIVLLYNLSPSIFSFGISENGIYIAFITYAIGYKATEKYMKKTKKHDPKEVVIDEVVGIMLAISIACPESLSAFCYMDSCRFDSLVFLVEDNFIQMAVIKIFICFALFRFFDITKPSIVGVLDKKLDDAHGVLLDDVFAGILAGISAKLLFDLHNIIYGVT